MQATKGKLKNEIEKYNTDEIVYFCEEGWRSGTVASDLTDQGIQITHIQRKYVYMYTKTTLSAM